VGPPNPHAVTHTYTRTHKKCAMCPGKLLYTSILTTQTPCMRAERGELAGWMNGFRPALGHTITLELNPTIARTLTKASSFYPAAHLLALPLFKVQIFQLLSSTIRSCFSVWTYTQTIQQPTRLKTWNLNLANGFQPLYVYLHLNFTQTRHFSSLQCTYSKTSLVLQFQIYKKKSLSSFTNPPSVH